MTSEEAKAVVKAAETVTKGLREVLTALNKNTLDCAQSLRKMAESMEHVDDDFWHPVFGPDGEIPGENYDWVIVKRRTLGRDMKPSGVILPIPQIAKYENGNWISAETNNIYETEDYPYEVIYWRPIPGDNCTTLYANNKPIRRVNAYED